MDTVTSFPDPSDLLETPCPKDPLSYSAYRGTDVPICIDNGACYIRAGWSDQSAPPVRSRNVAFHYKPKGNPHKHAEVNIGYSILEEYRNRSQTLAPYDGPIVRNQPAQEVMMDFVFTSLGIDADRITHPLIITEPFANTLFSRSLVHELAFECYDVPSVCSGIDSLFSFYHHLQSAQSGKLTQTSMGPLATGLVVRGGAFDTHVIPIVRGVPELPNMILFAQSLRIQVGGSNMVTFMQRILQLEYPIFKSEITEWRAEHILTDYCYIPPNYNEELALWNIDGVVLKDGFNDRSPLWRDMDKSVTFQLPVPQKEYEKSAHIVEEKKRARAEQGKRLAEMVKKRNEEKKRKIREEFQSLQDLMAEYEGDAAALTKHAKAAGYASIAAMNSKFQELQEKVAKANAKENENHEEPKVYDESLINVPSEQLDPQQLKEKRKQVLMRNSREARERIRREKEEAKAKKLKEEAALEEWRQAHPREYVLQLREKRQMILDEMSAHERESKSGSGRRATSSRQRLSLVALQTSAGSNEESFGANDEDWDVYVTMASDKRKELMTQMEEELFEVEEHLRKYDSAFDQPPTRDDIDRQFQLTIGPQRIRVPEIVFQPRMVGVDQAGLAEVLNIILKKYDEDLRSKLCENVYVMGGVSNIKGFDTRIEAELRMLRPTASPICIHRQSSGDDAWKGMAKFAQNTDLLSAASVTRAMYDENGADYLTEHCCGNRYFAMPSCND